MDSSSSPTRISCNFISRLTSIVLVITSVIALMIGWNRLLLIKHLQVMKNMRTVQQLNTPSDIKDHFKPAKCKSIVGCVSSEQDDDFLNRRFLSFERGQYYISFEEKSKETNSTNKQSNHRLPAYPRPLKTFTIPEVVNCFDSLSIKRKRRPMHITFMGDSTIRRHFLSFLEMIPNYDRIFRRNSTTYAEYYFHEDRNATSPLMDNLLISFYWRNLIRSDLISDFQRWSSLSYEEHDGNSTPAPDIVVIGVTCHHLSINNVSSKLEEYEHLLEHKLLPVMKQSLKANPFQEIIWVYQSPTGDYVGPIYTAANLYIKIVNIAKLFYYNRSIRRILKDSGIVIWDSINVIVEDYLNSCALTGMIRVDKAQYLNCDDFIHPGFVASSISTQLLINHICAAAA